jgi:hypothetical protein
MSAILLHQFSDIWTVKSIYQINNPNQYFALVDTIVSGMYSPEHFYRDFEYNTRLVQEMIDKYESDYSSAVKITKLTSFLTYLNTEIPNTEREEFDNAFN